MLDKLGGYGVHFHEITEVFCQQREYQVKHTYNPQDNHNQQDTASSTGSLISTSRNNKGFQTLQ